MAQNLPTLEGENPKAKKYYSRIILQMYPCLAG
jgi:hypothetical protein